eukprot:GHVQ01013755.1.p1 GENE.GHVQ01013755.1~~GHVQ01013755.1.p1  ORF type:complete len:940 (-),score=175.18 GHVQ01013755.1:3016-5835(-)
MDESTASSLLPPPPSSIPPSDLPDPPLPMETNPLSKAMPPSSASTSTSGPHATFHTPVDPPLPVTQLDTFLVQPVENSSLLSQQLPSPPLQPLAFSTSDHPSLKRKRSHSRVIPPHTPQSPRPSVYAYSCSLPLHQEASYVTCCDRYCFIATMGMNSSVQVWEYEDSYSPESNSQKLSEKKRKCNLIGPVCTLQHIRGLITCMRVSADSARLLVCTMSGNLYMWNVSPDMIAGVKEQSLAASHLHVMNNGASNHHQHYDHAPFIPEEDLYRPAWVHQAQMSCDVLYADFLQDNRTAVGVGKRPAGYVSVYHRDTGLVTAHFAGFVVICKEPSAPPLPVDLSRIRIGSQTGTCRARMHDFTCISVDRHNPPSGKGKRDGVNKTLPVEGRWVAVGDAWGNLGTFFLSDEWLDSLYSMEGERDDEIEIGTLGRSGHPDVAMAAFQLCARTVEVADVAWKWRQPARGDPRNGGSEDGWNEQQNGGAGGREPSTGNPTRCEIDIIAACGDGYLRMVPLDITLSTHFSFAPPATPQPRYDIRGCKPRRIYGKTEFNSGKLRQLKCSKPSTFCEVKCVHARLLHLAKDYDSNRYEGEVNNVIDGDDGTRKGVWVGAVLIGCNSMRYCESAAYSIAPSETTGGEEGSAGESDGLLDEDSSFCVRLIEYDETRYSPKTSNDLGFEDSQTLSDGNTSKRSSTGRQGVPEVIGVHKDSILFLAVSDKYAVSVAADGQVNLFERTRPLLSEVIAAEEAAVNSNRSEMKDGSMEEAMTYSDDIPAIEDIRESEQRESCEGLGEGVIEESGEQVIGENWDDDETALDESGEMLFGGDGLEEFTGEDIHQAQQTVEHQQHILEGQLGSEGDVVGVPLAEVQFGEDVGCRVETVIGSVEDERTVAGVEMEQLSAVEGVAPVVVDMDYEMRTQDLEFEMGTQEDELETESEALKED